MSNKKILIFSLLPLLPFGLPNRENQLVEVDEKQGQEMIDAGYGRKASDDESKEYNAKQKAKASSEKKANETDNAQLKADLEAAKSELETATGENTQLKADLEAAKSELETATGENTQLKADLETAKGDLEKAKAASKNNN
ncbi:hypothetical protein G4D82_12275 [Flavobacterium sp. CYK-4]|uniref:hypothetical protein n=1 Tax=Flavobacterium lotistagni TaxID=2709660 RepID=UPI00140C3720|nr:hypothetical protein [Flavobacterium lotistagni]NHM08002.1 hypothetical protein [Flavobacterium lotistagni]